MILLTTHDTHQSIESYSDAVARGAVGRRQDLARTRVSQSQMRFLQGNSVKDLRRNRIERPIVDVQAAGDCYIEAQVLPVAPDCRSGRDWDRGESRQGG